MNKSLNLNETKKNSTIEIKKIELIQLKKPSFKKKARLIKKFSPKQKYKIKSLPFFVFLIIVSLSYKFMLKRKAFDEFKPHKVFIEAHRGVNREIFENTKESILLSMKYGLDSFETDCWLSKDNVLVLVHGGYIGDYSGFYNSDYMVVNSSWDELSKARTKRGNYPLPRLEDIMKLTKNKIFMNLEIKDWRVDQVFPKIIELIEKYDYFDQIAISSTYHEYYQKIVEFNQNNTYGKKISFGFVYGEKSNSSYYPYNFGNNSLNLIWTKINKNLCNLAHANGMAIAVWFFMGVNETEQILKHLFDSGIDILCTNEPLNAKKFRYKYYKHRKIRKR